MMELTCALVLLVQISFVISNPYGYGTRASASAKAEASATAGGFSKSFSSSSASSSGSSSASSSAFSYSSSGSGASLGGSPCGSDDCQHGVKGSTGSQGAYNGNNASPGMGATGHYNTDINGSDKPKTDCASGNCQPVSNSGSAGPTGSSNAYSSAKAIASSAAGVQAGSAYEKGNTKPGCEGSDCKQLNGNYDAGTEDTEKCTTGSCGTTPQVETPSADFAQCASGQCGPNGQSGSTLNDYGSNDIKVPSTSGASTVKSDYGSYGQTSTTNSGCKYGNCGGQPASNPSSYTPEYPPCSSSDCNNYGQGSSNIPSQSSNKPSILLTTPKECSTPNCQSAQTKPPNTNSYPTSNYGASSQTSFTNPSTTPCNGGNCNFDSTKAPYSASSVTNSLSSNKPSYGSSPSYSSFANLPEPKPGLLSPPGPANSCTGPPGTPCNAVFVAPVCAPGSPNCNTGPTTGYHGYNSALNPGPLLPPGPAKSCTGPPGTPCNDVFVAPVCAPGSPNCNVGPTTGYHGYNSAPKPGPLSPPKPSSICAGPPGTPCNDAFVGPVCAPGSTNCNEGPTTGNHGYNAAPKPGPLSPSGPSSGCAGPPGTPCNDAIYASAPKPSPSSPPGPASSCTGPPGAPCNDAFVAPVCAPGSPNCNAGQTTGYHGYNSAPKPGPLSPPRPASICAGPPGTPCNDAFVAPLCAPGSPNCNARPTTGYQSYNPSTSFPITQNSIATPSHNSPSGSAKPGDATESDKPYKGSFGGPSGILKPNEFEAPSVPFTPSTSQSIPETSNPGCGTGNCGKPSSPSYGAASGSLSAPGFGGPAGVLKPNELAGSSSTYNKPASGSLETKPSCITGNCGQGATPNYSHAGSGAQEGASASASADAVAYTGGFGGPPGVLKPYDGGKIDAASGKPQSGQYVPQQGEGDGGHSNNGLGSHQGSYSNNGVGSYQGAYSNNGVGDHQGSYSNNGAEAHQGSYSNNGAGAHQGSYSNKGVGSHQGSYSNNGAASQPTGASVGAISGSNNYNSGSYGQKASGGCGGSGCGGGTGSYGSRSYSGSLSGSYGGNSGPNFGSDGLGLTKTGEGWNGANAKSMAGAASSRGYGGYASSSASAHATSGAAIKGSYGKR